MAGSPPIVGRGPPPTYPTHIFEHFFQVIIKKRGRKGERERGKRGTGEKEKEERKERKKKRK
jgi:hypothetical protein